MKSAFIGCASLLVARATSEVSNISPISASERGVPRLQREIVMDNGQVGVIEIFDQEEPADAVFKFGKQHGLEGWQRAKLLENVCESLTCARKEALLWSVPVSINDDVELFQVYEGVEPADEVESFMKKHHLPEGYREIIMEATCSAIECTRVDPVIWKKTVHVDGKWNVNIEILRGQEPAEEIFSALRPHGVPYIERRKIFDQAVKDGVPFSTEFAQLLSKKVVLEDDSFAGTFTMYDDGNEPVDALYNFAQSNFIEKHFDQIAQALLPKLCELAICRRHRPVVWRNVIKNDDDKELGTLELLQGDEPIDIIDNFFQQIPVGIGSNQNALRQKLLEVVCKSITCSRTLPIVYRKTVDGENRKPLGEMKVYEGEEVIDAAVRFIRGLTLSIDEIALKNHFFGEACAIKRVKCTRNVAIVFEKSFRKEDGSQINTLTIYENEIPADKVYRWCQDNNLSMGYFENIMNVVCDSDMVICNRRDPVSLSIPINGPDGEFVNTFELKVGQEPVDALYGFFAANGLFKKKWDFYGVFQQICVMKNVECKRQKAVKHFDGNFTMGGVAVGQLVVWEDQEVVDVLYSIRQHHNLTEEHQMTSFIEICKKPEVLCERTRAVVFKKTEITKLDYEKFGNETCKRQFVGLKFRTSFHNMPFGSSLAEFLKRESSKSVMEHPLFCIFLLLLLQALFHFISCIPSIKQRIRRIHKTIIFLWIVVFVSTLQAVLVEPDSAMDQAMHAYEGKLPDLVILEKEEPVDALINWGKLAARKHHPIVRENIYWEILDEVCNQLTCTRTRAWESLKMGTMNYFGQEFEIEFFNPDVDPISREQCQPTSDGRANSCLVKSAEEFCDRLWPPPNNCVEDITKHIASQLESTDSDRLDAKCSYKRLGLEMDAPGRELYKKAASVARDHGMNISPFRRVDNGTIMFDAWSKETREAHAAIDTFHKIKDPESREWNDKPCEPVLGGALCAKTDKDGNMMIEV